MTKHSQEAISVLRSALADFSNRAHPFRRRFNNMSHKQFVEALEEAWAIFENEIDPLDNK